MDNQGLLISLIQRNIVPSAPMIGNMEVCCLYRDNDPRYYKDLEWKKEHPDRQHNIREASFEEFCSRQLSAPTIWLWIQYPNPNFIVKTIIWLGPQLYAFPSNTDEGVLTIVEKSTDNGGFAESVNLSHLWG